MNKIIYLLLVILVIVGFFIACNDELESKPLKETFTDSEAKTRVLELNTTDILDISQAFTVTQSISPVRETEEEDKIWSILVNKPGTKDQFVIDLGLLNDFELPTEIETANVTFLRDQLILTDQNEEIILNFFINREGSVNSTPNLNTINGKFLRISSVPFGEKAGGRCRCKCVACAAVPGCPLTTSCSCTSSCNGCSVSCSSNAEATCTDSCTPQ